MDDKFRTLDEMLQDPKYSIELVEILVTKFREREEWGSRGLYKKIADKSGFSAAYVSRVLNGKQRLTKDFFLRMCNFIDHTPKPGTFLVEYPNAYVMLDVIFHGYEGFLRFMIWEYERVKNDDFILKQAMDVANRMMAIAELVHPKLKPEHLEELKKLASKFIAIKQNKHK